MKKISVMFAVFFCCIMTMTLLTACKDDNEDSPTPTSSSTDKDLVGDWVADLTGKTYVMWSSGNAWDKMTFKARGLQWLCNINEGYEQSTFHQLTGWGNWLRINNGHPLGNPTSGGGEPLTKE